MEHAAKEPSKLSKVLDFIGTAVIVIVIVLCLSISVPRLFGFSAFTVLTGSMEPSIPVGSVIYSSAVDPSSLEKGDVIVFRTDRSEVPITHRVVENRVTDGQIITKGDANEDVDIAPVSYYDVIGKVRLHLPVLGRVLSVLGTITGKLSLMAVVLGGTLLCVVARIIK